MSQGADSSAWTRLRRARSRGWPANRIRYLLVRRLPGLRRARTSLERLRPLLGRRLSESLRMHTLALLVGDYETAAAAAGANLRGGTEQSLFVYLAALWAAGDADGAFEQAAAATRGGDEWLRAVVRFYEFVERPNTAREVLVAMQAPDRDLLLHVAAALRRHGSPQAALALIDGVLAKDPANSRARTERDRAESDRRLLGWSWAGAHGSECLAPTPRRVLHMVERSLPHHRSGSTYRTHYTVLAQREAGLDAHVVTQPGFPWNAGVRSAGELQDHNGIAYHRLRDGGAPRRRMDQRLEGNVTAAASLVRELRPAILHPASDYKNACVALRLGADFGIPVVYEVRGFPEVNHHERPGSPVHYEQSVVRRRIESECWRRANHVVTLAEVMKRHIVAHGIAPERVTVIPNAVDAERFAPLPRDQVLAARLGIEPDETVVGYVSTFARYEGIGYLIEAVARLRHEGRSVRAVLVGDGPERPQLEQLARRLKVADRVMFTGRVDHERLRTYYGMIDVFVVPRTAEITCQLVTPLKPYEAMAMERAVVISGTEALSEMVVPGETGLLFEPEDVISLTSVIEELIEDEGRRLALGFAAREWVRENRSWRQNVERYRELYAALGVAA